MKEHIDRCINRAESTIVTELLPETLRDAVQITKEIGERYLWVDCICINQDDIHELTEQVGLMDRIFANAYLTIISLTTANVHSQIPGLRPHSRVKSTSEATVGGRTIKAMCAHSVVGEFDGGPWERRGWTYQEWLLSRRCLFISDHQILFRCQFASGLESFVPPRLQQYPNIHEMPKFWADERSYAITLSRLPLDATLWNFETYAKLVDEYTQRRLSKETDILRAFGGLMNKLKNATGMIFVEGLPVGDLLNALMWTCSGGILGGMIQRREQRPSWSWDGWILHAEYCLWQREATPSLDPDFNHCYQKVHRDTALESKQAEHWAGQGPRLPKRVILLTPSIEGCNNPRRAYQLKCADLAASPQTDGSTTRSILVTTETRSVWIKINSGKQRTGDYDIYDDYDNVLYSGTDSIIRTRRAGRLIFLSIAIASFDEGIPICYDAILLCELEVEDENGQWNNRVMAMIINRLGNGTVERVGIFSIRRHDWYSLPLVKEVEHLVLV